MIAIISKPADFLVVGEPEGEEELARTVETIGVDFLDDGTDARVVARPVAYRQFDRDALAVAHGAIDVDDVVDLRQFLAGNGRRLLFEVAQAAFLPELQHGIEEILAVLEVPVEAALGDTEVLGQNLDAQARNPMLGEHVDGAFDPVVAVELCACPAFGCHWSEFVTIR